MDFRGSRQRLDSILVIGTPRALLVTHVDRRPFAAGFRSPCAVDKDGYCVDKIVRATITYAEAKGASRSTARSAMSSP